MESIAATSTASMSASEPTSSAQRAADLEATILTIFDRQLGLEVPEPDTDLVASGTLDSLVLVRLLVALEERLGTRIRLERLDMSDFRTVSRIARFLSRDGAAGGDGAGGWTCR